MSFPKGFNTVVGEKGVILSGGQKQRVALARSVLNNTAIFILDDPISQVDKETGEAMIRSIRSVTAERTLILVSHGFRQLNLQTRLLFWIMVELLPRVPMTI